MTLEKEEQGVLVGGSKTPRGSLFGLSSNPALIGETIELLNHTMPHLSLQRNHLHNRVTSCIAGWMGSANTARYIFILVMYMPVCSFIYCNCSVIGVELQSGLGPRFWWKWVDCSLSVWTKASNIMNTVLYNTESERERVQAHCEFSAMVLPVIVIFKYKYRTVNPVKRQVHSAAAGNVIANSLRHR